MICHLLIGISSTFNMTLLAGHNVHKTKRLEINRHDPSPGDEPYIITLCSFIITHNKTIIETQIVFYP